MTKNELISSSAVYSISSFTTSAIPFLLLPILTRFLTPADYGIVAMFGIWLSIIGVFVGLSVQGAIGIRYFDRERINIQQYVSSCFCILLTTTGFVVIFVLFFRSILNKYMSLPTDWLLGGILVSGMQFAILVRFSLWQVAKQPLKYGLLQIAQSGINAGLSFWLVVIVGFAWEGRLLAICVATLIVLLISLMSLWREGWLRLNINYNYVWDALKFGVPLIPHALGGMLLATIDRIMVSNMLGIDQAGIYTVALQIGMILSLVTVSINQAYAPWLFEKLMRADDNMKFSIVRFTYLYFIVLVAAALIIGLCAPQIFSVIAGDKYMHGAEVVIYISMGFAFAGMYYMVTNYVFFAGRTGWLSMNTLFAGLVNVVLTYILIKHNGTVGAGKSFMISQAIMFLGTWRLANYAYPMPWIKYVLRSCNVRGY